MGIFKMEQKAEFDKILLSDNEDSIDEPEDSPSLAKRLRLDIPSKPQISHLPPVTQ